MKSTGQPVPGAAMGYLVIIVVSINSSMGEGFSV
jgi:hypothetical protein